MSFATKFYELEGVTIGERKKNLFKLFQDKSLTGGDEFFATLRDLKPNTLLEGSFKVEALIYFRRTLELLEVLKEGNEVFVSKIIKQEWFFKEAFQNMEPRRFVNEFLPLVSYSIRAKVLKKISYALNEDQVDEIFDALLDRYGLSVSLRVLPGCSIGKIEAALRNNGIFLSTTQLKNLFQKDPNLILIYAEEYKKNTDTNFQDTALLVFIAQSNIELFWQLCDKYNCTFKLGRETTKKVLPVKISDVVNDPQKYMGRFRNETLVRALGVRKEFKQFYKNIFPRNKYDLAHHPRRNNYLLKYYPKRNQFEFFSQTFQEVFGDSVWQNLSSVPNEFLDIVYDQSARKKFAKFKYDENNKATFIAYYPIEESISILREKINVTSAVDERNELIMCLLKTCSIHNDMNALEQVLKYFCYRHRNDHQTVRGNFMFSLLDEFRSRFDSFSENHWKYINEIFRIQCIKKEKDRRLDTLKVKYLEFLHKSNHNMTESLKMYIEEGRDMFRYYAFPDNSVGKNPKFDRDLYLLAINVLQGIQNVDRYTLSTIFFVIKDVLRHNKRNPNHQINILDNPELVKLIKENCQSNQSIRHFVQEVVGELICKTQRNELENELVHLYFTNVLNGDLPIHKKVVQLYLKHDPVTLNKYVKNVGDYYMSHHWAFINLPLIRMYSHLNMDRKFREYFESQMDGNDVGIKCKTSLPLSILLSTEEYVKLTEKKLPESFKLDLEKEIEENEFRIRCKFAENLKNVIVNHSDALALAVKFCTGAYLNTTLSALYSLFRRTPENALDSYLEILEKKADSAKKHVFYLSTIVQTREGIKHLFDPNREQKESLIKHIYNSFIKYFRNNPRDDFLHIVLFYLSRLNKSDTETLKKLAQVDLPKKYRPAYVENAWALFENLKQDKDFKETQLEIDQFSLLNLVKGDAVKGLSQTFCKHVIEKYFLKIDEEKHSSSMAVINFVFDFLISRPEEENYKFVFENVKIFMDAHFNKEFKMSTKRISSFLNAFVSRIESYDVPPIEFFEQFSIKWHELFSPVEMFDEYLLLKLFRLKIEAGEPMTRNFPEKVVPFLEQTINDFGPLVFNRFCERFKHLLKSVAPKDKIELYLNMLEYSKRSNLVCVFIIDLLSTESFEDIDVKEMYDKLLDILRSINSDIVRLHFNVYLKNN